jgi:hypothetical protein
VLDRYVHNDRLIDALGRQALSALTASPDASAYYRQLRARGTSHHAALRQLGNRLVGILHGYLKTGTAYNEATAWPTDQDQQVATKAMGCLSSANAVRIEPARSDAIRCRDPEGG